MDDLISRAAATRAAVISVRDYLGNIDSERDIHIEEGLHEVPAVDAIPVEWLNDRIYDMKRAPLYRRYAEMLLMEWLQEQKEQEAR